MDANLLLQSLNQAQCQAVAAPPGHLLVLAGAGSGKTRVLVHRIAWLIRMEHVSPYAILAVTFTNKAAAEMRQRIEAMIGPNAQGMWIGTFHALAHRLLRMHWQDAKLPQNFQVMDSEDQHRLIRRVLRSLNLDEDQWAPKQAQWFINAQKDSGYRAKDLRDEGDLYTKTMLKIYLAYEQACDAAGLVDFAELLLRAYELWLYQPHLLAHYQQRFRHVLVDEFQDTNAIQYLWIKKLISVENYIMAVGDDDQSIYGWRGACIDNMKKVQADFPRTQVVRLEQNYRSTGTILAAANALIQNNGDRLGKNLWTEDGKGELIKVYTAFNEIDEARYIVDCIKKEKAQQLSYNDIAILYRSNAQSRVLEEALIQAGIPYRIYGGLRFFERAEIKDALAYLRLLAHRHDDIAFERVINTPTRSIGQTTLATLRQLAREQGTSLWTAAQQALTTTIFAKRAATAIAGFISLIEQLDQTTRELPLEKQTEQIIKVSGLYDHYEKEKGEKGQARLENLAELVSAARQFRVEEDGISVLQAFLTHTALEAGENQAEAYDECVQLMTMHSAKGLEFPLVVLCGMEEGLFPHQMSMQDPARLEEERRLCYVGITRARQKLHLTHAELRRLHGKEIYARPSRFLAEIPTDYIEEVRIKAKVSRPLMSQPIFQESATQAGHGFKIGGFVSHPKFGEGIVIACEGMGEKARIQVKFATEGFKWLLASYLTAVQ